MTEAEARASATRDRSARSFSFVRSKRAKRIAAWLPLVVATVAIARTSISAVTAKLGHPGAALDDAYIHFQYARAIAEGHPLRFQAGEPLSTGATSWLWPAILSIPYALGFQGQAILWPAWILSFAALGFLAYETYALAKPLAGTTAAVGAGAMTLLFGGFIWGAASGMEVVPFAWLCAHLVRRSAQWVETAERRTRRELLSLIAFAAAAPLMRPEGAIFSILAGVAVAMHPHHWHPRARASVLAFPLVAILPNLAYLVLTGSFTSSTATVKLLAGNPYFAFGEATAANVRLLVGTLLNGEQWSAEFLPSGGNMIAFLGLGALLFRGNVTEKTFRAVAIVVLALAIFVPCTYVTFLWNRLRYLWPFATGWFIGIACLARVIGGLLSRIDPRAAIAATTLLAGGVCGMLWSKLDGVIEDVALSASGIDRQQVALGRWAETELPKDARIGVNDTGAIAYFSKRKTFDVVGLTTASEGIYWVAGPASRLEHYEQLKKTSPASLPTHFVVYPEWMNCSAVLGRALHEAVVTDSTILGGQVMRVYEARYDFLGSGDAPWTHIAALHDDIDIADLESERAHRYQLLGARDGEQLPYEAEAPDHHIVVDGGRTARLHDVFVATVPKGKPASLVARVLSIEPITLHARAGEKDLGAATTEAGRWTEVTFGIPTDVFGPQIRFEVNADKTFTSFHYWIVDPS